MGIVTIIALIGLIVSAAVQKGEVPLLAGRLLPDYSGHRSRRFYFSPAARKNDDTFGRF